MDLARYYLLLDVVEAVALIGLAGFCLTRLAAGSWALVAGLGGALTGVVVALYAAAVAQQLYGNSYSLSYHLGQHHLGEVLPSARVLGLLLVVAGCVSGRRAQSL